ETRERVGDPVGRESNVQHRGEADLAVRLRQIAADERHGVAVPLELTGHVHTCRSSEDPTQPPLVAMVGADLLGVARTTCREAQELLPIQAETPTLPRFQRTRSRAVAFDLSFDEMLLLRNGKVGMNGGGPSMSDDVSDGRRLRRS